MKKKRVASLLYFGAFAGVIAFVAWLIHTGLAERPTVEISFDVGKIIEGLLAGIGVLAAGIAYAVNTLLDGDKASTTSGGNPGGGFEGGRLDPKPEGPSGSDAAQAADLLEAASEDDGRRRFQDGGMAATE